jgi:hypothetical protein
VRDLLPIHSLEKAGESSLLNLDAHRLHAPYVRGFKGSAALARHYGWVFGTDTRAYPW